VSTAPVQILAEDLQAHSEPIEARRPKCRCLPSDADQDGQVQTLQGGFSLGMKRQMGRRSAGESRVFNEREVGAGI
jgi:hypothetical protein